MLRKAYISDHLIDMRDRLQRNYEKLHQNSNVAGKDTADTAKNPEPEKVEIPENTVNSGNVKLRYMPSIRKVNGIEHKNARERRELEGRVIHDLAESECELELIEQELLEVRQFNSILKKTHAKLMEIAESSDAIDLAPLQAEYFAASGRRNAFSRKQNREEKILTGYSRTDNRGNWIVAGAIILSGALVSLVLLGIFS